MGRHCVSRLPLHTQNAGTMRPISLAYFVLPLLLLFAVVVVVVVMV